MNKQSFAEKIIQAMLEKDEMSQWLGIQLLDCKPGYAKIQMTVRQEMVNGFNIAHGGISYSFADSALAFSSNSHGRHAVSMHTDIEHLRPIHVGDIIIAETNEEYIGNKTAVYSITVHNQDDKKVALFKGTVFRKESKWFEE